MATKSPFITTAIPEPTPPTGDAASFGAYMQAEAKERIANSDAIARQRATECATPFPSSRSNPR
jgi:hypothetical protein